MTFPFTPMRFLGSLYRIVFISTAFVAVWSTTAAREAGSNPQLQLIADFPHQQVTGVTVAKDGRIFVCFPFWADGHTTSVAELIRGKPQPFPNRDWNRKVLPEADRFVCVQSVVVDDNNTLWIVDAGSPKQTGVVLGGAKLVEVDLNSNQIKKVIRFDDRVTPTKSYLNDVRVDTAHHFAFLTESRRGSLIVVNLGTGQSRAVLTEDPSTKMEPHQSIRVEGHKLIDPETESAPAFQADSLALDSAGGWLYFKALTGKTLYRLSTADLENGQLSDAQLAGRLQKVAVLVPSDGAEFRNGRVYLTSIEDDAIVYYDVANKSLHTLIKDPLLKWPDTMAWGPDGSLYVTCSQIHLTPKFNEGENKSLEPFRLFRLEPAAVQ